jgi:hypothetical protein
MIRTSVRAPAKLYAADCLIVNSNMHTYAEHIPASGYADRY